MLLAVLLIVRVATAIAVFRVNPALEERFLRRELPGYREYAERVRYRVVPGIW